MEPLKTLMMKYSDLSGKLTVIKMWDHGKKNRSHYQREYTRFYDKAMKYKYDYKNARFSFYYKLLGKFYQYKADKAFRHVVASKSIPSWPKITTYGK